MIMHTFSCSDGHITERLVSMDTKELECPDCDQMATKVISCPQIKTDANSWKSVRRWAKQRESHIKYERKRES